MKGRMKMTLGESLKTIRKRFNMTQDEVAVFLGVSRSGYTYYETGKSEPSIDTLKKLATIYDITVDEILSMPSKKVMGRKIAEDDIAASGADPIMFMKKDEKSLDMAYRLASKENKEKILSEAFALASEENVEYVLIFFIYR